MDIPAESWRRAIEQRYSRRSFSDQRIDEDMLLRLEALCETINASEDGVRVIVAPEMTAGVFRGIVGAYGKVSGAPSGLIFLGNTATTHINERVGYHGEAAVLEATALGLDTCWVGGFFSREKAASYAVLAPEEQVFAVSPLGYAQATTSFSEKMLKRMAKSHKRKPLEEIAPGIESGTWPEWAVDAAAAARVAPSAVNRQPWRFRMEEASVVLYLDSPKDSYQIAKRLDCGIAMMHFETAALSKGMPGDWTFLEGTEVARYTPR
jgi:hypothetical protein